MTKSEKLRPDWQVIRDGEYGSVYKPVRLLVLPCGGMIALMHGYDDSWCVFSDAKGIAKRSTVYRSKSFGESAWQELCDELTRGDKERLIAEAKTSTPSKRADIVSELARLEIADDEKYEAIAEKASQFSASHTREEVEAHVADLGKELDAYRERAANANGAE